MPGTAYVTVAEARQLGLSGRAFANTDADDFAACCQAASDEASSFLANQYVLPLTAYGNDLKLAVSKIAVYEFLSVRGLNPDQGGSDKNIYDRAVQARAWLKMVGEGKATPVGIQDSSPNDTPGVPGYEPRVVSSSSRGFESRGCPGRRGPFVGD